MSETDTERNEAINTMDAERAIKILSDDAGNTEYDDFVNALDLAISALRNQSEAERKIERAILELENNMYHFAECFDEGVYGKSAEAVLKDARDRCKGIIEILEGKADV